MLAFSAFHSGQVEVRARAKVNLGLEVLGRRADGYHELRSVMWAIELADRVTLEASGAGIEIECATPHVPRTPDNLAWRAAELVCRETGAAPGLRIRIHKRIPVAAGLGGGSADAAAVLAGLGRLRGRRLGSRRLGALAVALGMDVPFFLGRSPALAHGRGEELRPVAASADLSLVLANPGFPLATHEVYAGLEPADYGDGRPGRGAPRWGPGGRGHRHERARARGRAPLAGPGRGQGGAAGGRVPRGADVGQRPNRARDRALASGGAPDPGRAGGTAVAALGHPHGYWPRPDDPGRAGGLGAARPPAATVRNDLGRGQAVRRGTLDPVFGGSNPPAPTNPKPATSRNRRATLDYFPVQAQRTGYEGWG